MLQPIVIKEISDYLKRDPEEVLADTRLDELGIDSLGAITILYELEDKLDIEVPNEAFESLETVGDIIEQLKLLVAKKEQG